MDLIGIALAMAVFCLVATAAAGEQVHNVLDYGAVPNGTTRCTAAIQKAIDACAAAGGGAVRFPANYQIAYTYFLDDQHENSLQYLNQILDDTKNPDERGKLQILAAFNYLHQKRWSDAEHVLDSMAARDENLNLTASSLRACSREGMDLPRKSPILAGLSSAVIPGTGKIYCGEYGDGIYSLIITGITGWLAWDGFRENGIRSVSGWVFGSVCSVFYAGNVYGSAIAARIYNHRLEAGLLKRLPSVPYE